MADQPPIDFNNLPTEALFSFFALDPLTLGKNPQNILQFLKIIFDAVA